LQVVPSPTVNVRNAANTANITDTMYAADDPDPTILPQGFVGNADGKIEFYVAQTDAQRVVLRLTKSGFTTQDVPIDLILPANRYNPRGAWSVATAYEPLDVVSNAGSSWVALQANTGVTPTEGANWTLVASGGIGTVQDEGIALPARPIINITGAGATATDDAANGRTNVAIAGSETVAARAYRAAALSIANATITFIGLDAESFDTGTLHNNVTNNSRITVPSAGKYLATGTVYFAAGTADTPRVAYIYVNGSEVNAVETSPPHASVTHSMPVIAVLDLAANDYVELAAYQASGGSLALAVGSNRTWLAVAKL
jgi:hypothetical protein